MIVKLMQIEKLLKEIGKKRLNKKKKMKNELLYDRSPGFILNNGTYGLNYLKSPDLARG